MADKTLFTLETEAKNALTNFKLGVASQLDKIARERDTAIEQREQAIDALREIATYSTDACQQVARGALLNLGEQE